MPFVCFHTRDSAYLAGAFPGRGRDDSVCRNANIQNYVPVEELVRRGYYAIRMGSIVPEPLATTNPRIIDYATTGRSDFLDIYMIYMIYMAAKCRFYLGGSSGLYAVPELFRRPVIHTNVVPLELMFTANPTT